MEIFSFSPLTLLDDLIQWIVAGGTVRPAGQRKPEKTTMARTTHRNILRDVNGKPTSGVILWEGPSRFDGSPIVVVATIASENRKTGRMIQTWILRRDVGPTEAIKSGDDASICGTCPHRGDGNGRGRSCYVNAGQAPRSVFNAYHRARYARLDNAANATAWQAILRLTPFRFGSYGDPAAVPMIVWRGILGVLAAAGMSWTGYTHAWRDNPTYRGFLMASCDTPAERDEASALGWRTFRVRTSSQATADREVICPASDEAGKRTTCDRCRLCQGAERQAKSVVIIAHGGIGILPNANRNLQILADTA